MFFGLDSVFFICCLDCFSACTGRVCFGFFLHCLFVRTCLMCCVLVCFSVFMINCMRVLFVCGSPEVFDFFIAYGWLLFDVFMCFSLFGGWLGCFMLSFFLGGVGFHLVSGLMCVWSLSFFLCCVVVRFYFLCRFFWVPYCLCLFLGFLFSFRCLGRSLFVFVVCELDVLFVYLGLFLAR